MTAVSELLDEVARSEAHVLVVAGDLKAMEVEDAWLRDALSSAAKQRALSRQAEEGQSRALADLESELELQRATANTLRADLVALQQEHQHVLSRLSAAQEASEAWQARIRSVSSDFESCTREWQAQLASEGAKWQQQAQTLRDCLTAAQAKASSDARELQVTTQFGHACVLVDASDGGGRSRANPIRGRVFTAAPARGGELPTPCPCVLCHVLMLYTSVTRCSAAGDGAGTRCCSHQAAEH